MSDRFSPSIDESGDKIRADEALPEVEPPSAGFIVQLFVVPGMIVLVIVAVWMLLHLLAHTGSDPTALVNQMKHQRANSWQLASSLADELRQNEAYKKDTELAKTIALFLDELLEQPLPKLSSDDSSPLAQRKEKAALRGFLCKALGEFFVLDDALPVLIKAATPREDEKDLRRRLTSENVELREVAEQELGVQLAALEAIALMAENSQGQILQHSKSLLPLLLAVSRNDDHKIALRASLALASIDDPQATKRLEAMLAEAHHVDVHYNVATGLARHGNPACIDILLEMLDPNEPRGLRYETDDAARRVKRAVILINALRSVRQLAAKNDKVDLNPLSKPVRQLEKADVDQQIRLEATVTLEALAKRAVQQ